MYCGRAFLHTAIAVSLLRATGYSAFAATVLVTEAEDSLPLPKEVPAPSDRSITRGPKIELDEDKGGNRARFHLKLKLKTFGGSAIDLNSVNAAYIKDPTAYLASRVRPLAQQSGIDIPDAQLPPGEHLIQRSIKDSDGRVVSKIIKLKIMP